MTGAAAAGPSLAAGARRPRVRMFKLRQEIPEHLRWPIAVTSVLFPLLVWTAVSATGLVDPLFLPTPGSVARALGRLASSGDLWADIRVTLTRVALGFGIVVAISVPLGLAMGSWPAARALFEPMIGLVRYMPAPAFIPLLIIWLGLGEPSKIALLVIGTVFFNTLMSADAASRVPEELINVTYTLGASRGEVVRKVIVPFALPGLVDAMRGQHRRHMEPGGGGRADRRPAGPRVPDRAGPAVPPDRHDLRRADRHRRHRRAHGPGVPGPPQQAVAVGPMKPHKLQMVAVTKDYPTKSGPVRAVEGIDLHVEEGELVCLVGASGCGKSTLLSVAAGLTDPTDGAVLVDGVHVIGPGPDRGLVPQSYSLYPWRTVAQNVAFGLEIKGLNRSETRERVDHLLDVMGLTAFAASLPRQLSGGMRQRVAIARAMATEPSVLLFDEPFGALDSQTRGSMREFVLQVKRDTGATILMVTHDVEEAVYLSNRVYVLTSRPGRIATELAIPFGDDRGRSLLRDPGFQQLCWSIDDLLAQQASATAGVAG